MTDTLSFQPSQQALLDLAARLGMPMACDRLTLDDYREVAAKLLDGRMKTACYAELFMSRHTKADVRSQAADILVAGNLQMDLVKNVQEPRPIDVDENWRNETTTFLFEDGSAIKVSGFSVRIEQLDMEKAVTE